MNDITCILSQIEHGDPSASDQLLPIVYGELRRLAAARMANERSDHTLEATGLVHEAYLRLVDNDQVQHWNSRGHFFAAAAEAMRRILVDHARKKKSAKRGGDAVRIEQDSRQPAASRDIDEILDVSDALDRLGEEDPGAADLVKLRFFAGFSLPEAAKLLGIPQSSAYEQWAYARAWLRCAVELPSE